MQNITPTIPTVEGTGYSSIMPTGETSARRQRIAMACQYCRHRKIKCCGSTPCANCQRARRSCEYAPVPEETNRATREKKAAAKAAKAAFAARATPYFVDQSVYSMPYHLAGPGPIRGTHVPPRRAFSTPGLYSPYSPAAPNGHAMMPSPAHFESPWMAAPPPVPIISVSPMIPVVPTMDSMPMATPDLAADDGSAYTTYAATAPVSPTESSTSSTQYAMPVTPVRKTILATPPATPSTTYFQGSTNPHVLSYTPQTTLPYSPVQHGPSAYQSSPTLCPGLPVQKPVPTNNAAPQPLVGLGIGIGSSDDSISAPYTHVANGEYLTAGNVWTQHDSTYNF